MKKETPSTSFLGNVVTNVGSRFSISKETSLKIVPKKVRVSSDDINVTVSLDNKFGFTTHYVINKERAKEIIQEILK